MTKDLEDTLAELGPGYREVVDRLSGAYRPLPQVTAAAVRREAAAAAARVLRHRRARASGWGVACLAAASLLVFLGLAAVFAVRPAPARLAGGGDPRGGGGGGGWGGWEEFPKRKKY